VRVDLALIVCGNRICEVITATLGPLPLDQLPKSKPVTPYAVLIDDTARQGTSNRRCTRGISPHVAQHTQSRQDSAGMRKPLRALAVAEDAPAGVRPAGSGPVPMAPGLPRDETRFSSRRLGRNPPSGRPASLSKTPQRDRSVASRDDFLAKSR
jgi:hypothetical protein